ncbi:DUF3247 family protein [Oleiagrimonas sp. C23AA]|uniref:DUF3247 family protein n=1 Tax=Oleiagrimonas sp. C23AA TaxID=2719047 RepID=UPI0014239901|nr:DUF3247 family protein [Oleiagrimonas sp. C23AA]NII11946.1 DUF3247 family protein [Oleiagrimonas sp. C23AA]
MGRHADHVELSSAACEHIEDLTRQLPANARVTVVEKNGTIYTGTVVERPITQVFKGPDGKQGINAVLRLEDPQVPTWNRKVWLDQIDRVEKLDANRRLPERN